MRSFLDPYFNSATRDRLNELGHQPELTAADAQVPLPGQRDRVVTRGRWKAVIGR
ncbi:hypothetical protein AB0M50_50245 [Nonomuraea fuscirosea]|uniref:hypothetical protein n=1 Tax=Nonomuraea fuscirosea TaxID=1291556 RepID=UPI00341B3B71